MLGTLVVCSSRQVLASTTPVAAHCACVRACVRVFVCVCVCVHVCMSWGGGVTAWRSMAAWGHEAWRAVRCLAGYPYLLGTLLPGCLRRAVCDYLGRHCQSHAGAAAACGCCGSLPCRCRLAIQVPVCHAGAGLPCKCWLAMQVLRQLAAAHALPTGRR